MDWGLIAAALIGAVLGAVVVLLIGRAISIAEKRRRYHRRDRDDHGGYSGGNGV